jgi:hypothetical protein
MEIVTRKGRGRRRSKEEGYISRGRMRRKVAEEEK